MRASSMAATAVIASFLSACQKSPSNALSEPVHAASGSAAPKVRSYTSQQWHEAIAKSYVETQRKTDEEGISEFSACFRAESPKNCALFAFGREDAFRGNRYFTSAISQLSQFESPIYLRLYVALQKCELPRLMLRPTYFSKEGWLFMSSVAVMADGAVVLDRSFDGSKVSRDSASHGVDEEVHLIATQEDVDGLRRAAAAKTVIIRLTGDKGYVTVPKAAALKFITDAQETVQIYDLLRSASSQALPSECPTSKI